MMTLPTKRHHHHYHRHSTCHRHPTKPITGFCASCLRERLSGIDPDTHLETPITHLAVELRRSKSHSSTTTTTASTSNHNASSSSTFSTSEDSRRKSCDVRPRNSLSDLFHIDDKRKPSSNRVSKVQHLKDNEERIENGEVEIARVRVCESVVEGNVNEIEEDDSECKTMKELIDLECERKRNAGTLWDAASLFSKKLSKWQRKQMFRRAKKKDHEEGSDLRDEIERKDGRFGESKSEIGEYGLGRRSCDTEPRLSIDVARFSFDEPRASWDGCLIGKPYPRLTPMVSVVEDVNLVSEEVENLGSKNNVGESSSPGGTVQTRDYYSDRRRWQSFDCSGSHRRLSVGDDETKSTSNAKVSPESVGLFHGAKLLVTERELKNSNWYALKDCRADNVDSLAKDAGPVAGGSGRKSFKFNLRSSVLKMWGLLPRKNESKCEDEASNIGGNVKQLAAAAVQTPRNVTNREPSGIVSQKLLRSYAVSARDSSTMVPGTSGIETKQDRVKRRDDLLLQHNDLLLQRNRSTRYSPNNLDNGLLRFYLTPMRGSRRSFSGKSRFRDSNGIQ